MPSQEQCVTSEFRVQESYHKTIHAHCQVTEHSCPLVAAIGSVADDGAAVRLEANIVLAEELEGEFFHGIRTELNFIGSPECSVEFVARSFEYA